MAICSGELTIWASQILEDLGDTTTPTGSVVSWLQNHLYEINGATRSQYYLNESGCIEPNMDAFGSGIYTQMYICSWLRKQALKAMGGMSYDWVRIEGNEQGSITKVSKNDVSKNYTGLAKDCKELVEELTNWYNGPYAGQVLYSQRCSTTDAGLKPPPDCCSRGNIFLRKIHGCC